MQSRQIDLTINKMTKAQYNAITPNADEVYLITDDNGLTQSDVTTALGYTPVNPSSLATVATTGSYNDLTDKPYIPSGVVVDQSFDPTSQNAQSGVAIAGAGFLTGITSSDVTTALGYTPYNSSNPNGYTSNVGTVTSVNNIQPVNGNVTISIPTVPTNISAFTNDAGYITSSALTGYATQSWVGEQGYITGISSSDVTTALGYTPYNSSNPNGYTSNVGTVTSVNNVQPVNGNVTLSIPSVGNGTVTFTQGGVTKGSITMNQSGNATIDFDASSTGGIQNTATGTDSLTILGTPATDGSSLNIGYGSATSYDGCIAIGCEDSTVPVNGAISADMSVAIGSGYDVYNGAYADGVSVAVGTGTIATNGSVAVGHNANASNSNNTAIGVGSVANGDWGCVAIGDYAQATATSAIQIGGGVNTIASTLQIGNKQLLNLTTGLIPDDRLSSNIARTSQITTPTYDSTNERITW